MVRVTLKIEPPGVEVPKKPWVIECEDVTVDDAVAEVVKEIMVRFPNVAERLISEPW